MEIHDREVCIVEHRRREKVTVVGADDQGRYRDPGKVSRQLLLVGYEAIFGRPPTDAETARASAFLRRVEAEAGSDGTEDDAPRLSAWQALCQVLVSSNEFFYIR